MTPKIGKQLSCEYSMSTIWAFDNIENKHTLYRGEDCMKRFCSSLREYATNVTIFLKTKKMLQLTKKAKMQQHFTFVEKDSQKRLLIQLIKNLETISNIEASNKVYVI